MEVVGVRAGEAATAAGVSVKALRYYEGLGLLQPQRRSNGYRVYSVEDVRAAAEIRALMALGLTTQEAEPFLECLRTGHDAADDCAESIAAYQRKIDQLEELIARLSRARVELQERMGQAARRGFRTTRHQDWIGQDNAMALPQPDPLPEGLAAPLDDGAARCLPGRALPALVLPATDGSQVRLDTVSEGRWVLFVYPLTGEPGVDVPRGWDEIPGARGCSQEACGFRDNFDQLRFAGVEQVVALSRTGRSTSRTSPLGCGCRTGCCPTRTCRSPAHWTSHLHHRRPAPFAVGRAAAFVQAADDGPARAGRRARLLSGVPA